MVDNRSERTEPEGPETSSISEDDQQAISDRSSGSAKIVHEVVRLQGEEELGRPIKSLLFSGFAAGVAISISLIAEGSIRMRLPDTGWRDLVVSIGYTIGFVVVILGKMQLFTETTVTAVLPLATQPTARNFWRLLRLWIAVFLANIAGTFCVAVLMSHDVILQPQLSASVLDISRVVLEHDFLETLWLAAPAGFLIASIAWILPNARGSEFWVILTITYIVSIAGFSHVVAGSGEVWMLYLADETTFANAVFGLILPTLIGNILGGTGLFAVLAHGQVRDEIK